MSSHYCIICLEEKEESRIIGEEVNLNGVILHAFFYWCESCEENFRRKHENGNAATSGGFGTPSDAGAAAVVVVDEDVGDDDGDDQFEWWWWYGNEIDDDADDDVLNDYVPSPPEDWDMEMWIISNNDHLPF